MAHSETGTQLLARLGARPSLEGLEPALFYEGPEAGSVYEFYGGEGTGKTEMTIHLIVRCLLPKTWMNIPVNGKDGSVVVVDTEYKFPMFRLVVVMEHRIKLAINDFQSNLAKDMPQQTETEAYTKNSDVPTESDIETLIKECLKKLYVLQCQNSFKLLMSLSSLDSIFSSNPNVSLLILDTVSAYYWVEKNKLPDSYKAQDTMMKPFISVLSEYVKNYKIVLICVKSALFVKKTGNLDWSKGSNSPAYSHQDSRGKDNETKEHCEFLGNMWSKFINHRFIFSRTSFSPNPSFTVVLSTERSKKSHVNFKVADVGIKFFP